MMAREKITAMLVPGGAVLTYELTRSKYSPGASERWRRYSLLSSMSSAIRERADDQNRSTDRSDMSNASEVSAVVKPAK